MARRRERMRGQIGAFMKAYERRVGRNGLDPNDRHYSHAFEAEIKRMKPEELDRLLRDDEDDED